ncbi:MAG: DegV family protein [Turicibacter sp.]|nr:DegV family protein [Turicibacter sp.]
MKIAIVTDSITNLRKADLDKYKNIRYVYLNVIINGESFRDLVEVDNEKLFQAIDQGGRFSTSQPAPKEFMDVYTELLKEYDYIFSLHCTEKVSGTVNAARLAKDSLESGAEKIAVYDMNTASIGVENAVLQVAQAIQDGKRLEEIIQLIEFNQQTSKLYLTIDDLGTLVKSGRMSKTKAAIGNLLNIKPILGFNAETSLDVVEKVRTKKKVLKWMVDTLARDVLNHGKHSVRITHVNAIETAEELKRSMELELGDKITVHISNEIGPVMAAHFGRGGFGASWVRRN